MLIATNSQTREMASIIARFATGDGEHTTVIDGLFFARRSSPTQPLYVAQWPCLALVVQGAKSLQLRDELFGYGVGDYLVTSIDLPVASRVTKASPRMPLLGFGMAIRSERLEEVIGRVGLTRRTLTAGEMRGGQYRSSRFARCRSQAVTASRQTRRYSSDGATDRTGNSLSPRDRAIWATPDGDCDE